MRNTTRKPRPRRLRLVQPPRLMIGGMPRKCADGGDSDRPAPNKGWTTKYCKWCKANGGPFTTHDTGECCKFDKDGKLKDRPAKPFDSSKKPCGKRALEIPVRWLI